LGLAFSSRFDRGAFFSVWDLSREGVIEAVDGTYDPELFALDVDRRTAVQYLVEGYRKFLTQNTREELDLSAIRGSITAHSKASDRTAIYPADSMDWRRDEPSQIDVVDDVDAVKSACAGEGEPIADPTPPDTE